METVEILALDLGAGLPPALWGLEFAGEVRLVTDADTLREAYSVAAEVWQQQVPDEDELARAAADLGREDARDLRAVPHLDGDPVAGGGGRSAAIEARCCACGEPRPGRLGADEGRTARCFAGGCGRVGSRGASLALVRSLVRTSGPVLRELGFEGYGFEHRLRLSPARDEGELAAGY